MVRLPHAHNKRAMKHQYGSTAKMICNEVCDILTMYYVRVKD